MTKMSLYFEPYVIALVAIQLTAEHLDQDLEDIEPGVKWYLIFDSNLQEQHLNYAVEEL